MHCHTVRADTCRPGGNDPLPLRIVAHLNLRHVYVRPWHAYPVSAPRPVCIQSVLGRALAVHLRVPKTAPIRQLVDRYDAEFHGSSAHPHDHIRLLAAGQSTDLLQRGVAVGEC